MNARFTATRAHSAMIVLAVLSAALSFAVESQPLAPLGTAKGAHPGRVVWVHNPDATHWNGPGDGHWWAPEHTIQPQVDRMVSRAICELAGESTDAQAWDKLIRYSNQARGKGDAGYKPGEKIAIKVNFVGFIWRGDAVNPDTYQLEKQRDYMNTSPQMILAVLRQLTGALGVRQQDISVGDTLALFTNEVL